MCSCSLLFFFLLLLCSSCKKEANQALVARQWLIQYTDNPAYTSTPQSTGIQEILTFNSNGQYSLTENNIVTNAGTYKTATAKNMSGQTVSSVLYTNTRMAISVAYYSLTGNADTLFFSHDLLGTLGSGARYYARQ